MHATKVANGLLGFTRKSIASRWREMNLHFYSALMKHLEHWVQFWVPQFKRNMGK